MQQQVETRDNTDYVRNLQNVVVEAWCAPDSDCGLAVTSGLCDLVRNKAHDKVITSTQAVEILNAAFTAARTIPEKQEWALRTYCERINELAQFGIISGEFAFNVQKHSLAHAQRTGNAELSGMLLKQAVDLAEFGKITDIHLAGEGLGGIRMNGGSRNETMLLARADTQKGTLSAVFMKAGPLNFKNRKGPVIDIDFMTPGNDYERLVRGMIEAHGTYKKGSIQQQAIEAGFKQVRTAATALNLGEYTDRLVGAWKQGQELAPENRRKTYGIFNPEAVAAVDIVNKF